MELAQFPSFFNFAQHIRAWTMIAVNIKNVYTVRLESWMTHL